MKNYKNTIIHYLIILIILGLVSSCWPMNRNQGRGNGGGTSSIGGPGDGTGSRPRNGSGNGPCTW